MRKVLINKLKVVKIDIPEAFQVGAIIIEFPFSWKIYRKKLLHNFEVSHWRKSITTFDWGELKDREKVEVIGYSKANAVSVKGKKKYDGMKNHLGPKKEQNKFMNSDGPKGPKGGCYVCGKIDHYV